MKTTTQTPKTTTQNVKQEKHAVNKTYGAAQADRFSDYIIRLDTTRGGYTYGDDWSGDDWRALCDIFGV